jgi:hypothetical protein
VGNELHVFRLCPRVLDTLDTFSVLMNFCILVIAEAPLPLGIDHAAMGEVYLPKDKQIWHQGSSRWGRGAPGQNKGVARAVVEEVGTSKLYCETAKRCVHMRARH